MGDDIDIREGGLVAVDTGSLRGAASRYRSLRQDLDGCAVTLRAQGEVFAGRGVVALSSGAIPDLLRHSAAVAAALADEAETTAGELGDLADTYEIVDLRARRAMALGIGAGIGLAAATMIAEARHPEAAQRADGAEFGRDLEVSAGVVSVANLGAAATIAAGAHVLLPGFEMWVDTAFLVLPLLGQNLQALLRELGHGTIEQGSRLRGEPEPVRVAQVGAVGVSAPPEGLGDALSRIPGDDARVRIETYTMPDGTRRYAVYLAGTRDFSVGGDDPWDMTSNLQLYQGMDASAYEAVVQAMRDAGVPDGAGIYLFGHSQGGMIADWLAMQGGYDVKMLVTAGSPTEAAVGEETLSVQLRQTDDVVQSLAAGGSTGRVGAEGSLVVERVGDPLPRMDDVRLAPHHLVAYVATARLVDASTDPRTAQLRSRLGELRGAASVTSVQYDAQRAAPDGDRARTRAPAATKSAR